MPAAENKPPSLVSEKLSRLLAKDSIGALATLVAGSGSVGAKLLVDESGATVGSLGNETLDQAVVRQTASFLDSKEETRVFQVKEFAPALSQWSEAQVLFERIQTEPRLVICGAGHVGASLAKLAGLMGYRATLIDDRAEFVTRERLADKQVELVAAENWADAVSVAVGEGRGVSVAVVTRGHSEDEECMRALLTSSNPDYVGLIGSKRRTNIVLQRLREKGVEEEKLKRVRAPVGLDIGAVTPEEVALAIMAEIVAVRRGGKGGSLSAWRRELKSREKSKE